MKFCDCQMKHGNLDVDGKEIINAITEPSCDAQQRHFMKVSHSYVNRKALDVTWILSRFAELDIN